MPAPCDLRASRRLRSILAVLMDGAWHTTMELIRGSGQVAVDTAVRELRAPPNNLAIDRKSETRRDAEGQRTRVDSYRLEARDRLRLLLEQAAALADGGES